MTDAMKHLGNLNIRYIDHFKPEETRTPDEIISKIRSGIERIGGNYESV